MLADDGHCGFLLCSAGWVGYGGMVGWLVGGVKGHAVGVVGVGLGGSARSGVWMSWLCVGGARSWGEVVALTARGGDGHTVAGVGKLELRSRGCEAGAQPRIAAGEGTLGGAVPDPTTEPQGGCCGRARSGPRREWGWSLEAVDFVVDEVDLLLENKLSAIQSC